MLWQRFGMTLLGIAAVVVIGLAGRRLAGPVAGLVAAALAAIYPNLWINDSLVMSESLAVPPRGRRPAGGLRLRPPPGLGRAIALGALAGLAALTRSELALLRRRLRRAGVVAGGRPPSPGVDAGRRAGDGGRDHGRPWALYNLGPVRATRAAVDERRHDAARSELRDGRSTIDIGGWDIRCLEPVPVDETVDASVRSEERRDVALDYITDHPGRLPVVVAARLGRIVDLYGLDSLVAIDIGEEKAEWAVWAGIVSWWLLAIAAVAGWMILGRPGRPPRTSTSAVVVGRARWPPCS